MPSYKNKKKSIVADSPAVKEHMAFMESLAHEQEVIPPAAAVAQEPAAKEPQKEQRPKATEPQRVFAANQSVPTKNVQTRVPLSVYEKLTRLKVYSDKEHTSIGDIVLQAINEYVANHPIL